MPTLWTTRAQVSGYRFIVRRAEHALVRRDVRLLHDPLRAHMRSFIVGAVCMLLVCAGFGIYGLIRPAGVIGNAAIILNRSDGQMYVVLNKTVHPVANLASARLATGRPDTPKVVGNSALRGYERGPGLGIVGAPNNLAVGHPAALVALCDVTAAGQRSIFRSDFSSSTVAALQDTSVLVVTGASGPILLTSTVHSAVGTDAAVRRVLGAALQAPRPSSALLVNSLTGSAAVATPELPWGAASGLADPLQTVGSVISVPNISGPDSLYLVVPHAVSPLSRFAAEVVRAASPLAGDVVSVPPSSLTGITIRDVFPNWPTQTPKLDSVNDAPQVCTTWEPGGRQHLWVGPETPGGQPLASADGPGPALDAVATAGMFVVATGLQPHDQRRESLYYISTSGVRYGISDAKAAAALGLPADPQPVPWSYLVGLPPGPRLAPDAALQQHDVPQAER